jgi:geranylgeranyl diphosphate synthase, type I
VDTSKEQFLLSLTKLKNQIDEVVDQHVKKSQKSVRTNYTPFSAESMDIFTSILGRRGKRIRGILTIIGYQMTGGKDNSSILQAAKIIEMIHAYLLIIDDVVDESHVRRGQASAHFMFRELHRSQKLQGDERHFGDNAAILAALVGCHAALAELTLLSFDDEKLNKASGILNYALGVTGQGQLNDFFNMSLNEVSEYQIDQVHEWKTAYYTILNPLTFGMVLAGADCRLTDAIRDFSLDIGKAFQVTDDIIGVFGDGKATGKDAIDDVAEGKKTHMAHFALQNATPQQQVFLRKCLGNHELTNEDFQEVKAIFVSSGAKKYAEIKAHELYESSLKSLDTHAHLYNEDSVNFLKNLAAYTIERVS